MPDELSRLKTFRLCSVIAAAGLLLLLAALVASNSTSPTADWAAGLALFLLLAALIAFVVLSRKIRNHSKADTDSGGIKSGVPRLHSTLLLAAFWFLLDAFFFQQGVISLLLILLCIVWMAPSAFMGRKDQNLFRFRTRRVAAYFLAAVIALGVIRANSYLAERRAQAVVGAVQQYRQKYGRFPRELGEITPEFLPSVPLAKYSLMWNSFAYTSGSQSPRLSYVAYPPFLRKIYNFETGTWGELD